MEWPLLIGFFFKLKKSTELYLELGRVPRKTNDRTSGIFTYLNMSALFQIEIEFFIYAPKIQYIVCFEYNLSPCL